MSTLQDGRENDGAGPTEGERPGPAPRRHPSPLLAGSLLLLFLGVLATGFGVLTGIWNEERARLNDWEKIRPASDDWEDSFSARVTLTSFDALKGELTLRVDFDYDGPKLLGADDFSLANDVWLVTNTVKGDNQRIFKAGGTIPSQEIVLPVHGVYPDYPFDEYTVPLDLQMGVEADDETTPLPVALEGCSALMGLDATFALKPGHPNEVLDVSIQMCRSRTVKVFSLFLNFAMLFLAAVILAITAICSLMGRKVELGMLTFFAGMLFAFPAVRGLQPAAPPLGSLTDYYATFWAQGSAALGLVVCGLLWIARDRDR